MQKCAPTALKFPVVAGATGILRQAADSSEEKLIQGVYKGLPNLEDGFS